MGTPHIFTDEERWRGGRIPEQLISMTRQQIADFLGISKRTLMRRMKERQLDKHSDQDDLLRLLIEIHNGES